MRQILLIEALEWPWSKNFYSNFLEKIAQAVLEWFDTKPISPLRHPAKLKADKMYSQFLLLWSIFNWQTQMHRKISILSGTHAEVIFFACHT